MNRVIVLFVLISFAVFAATGASESLPREVRVKGKIDTVTVFTDRALVKRIHALDANDKAGTIRFIELPQTVIPDSVRASATGATVTAISLRQIEKIYGEEWDDHPLKKKINRIEADVRREKDKLDTYNDQLKVLDQMMKLTTAQSDRDARAGKISVDSWDSALTFLEEKKQKYHEKIRTSEEATKKLRKELDKTRIEFNKVTQVAKTSGVEVEVSYLKNSASAKIELEYLVSSVSWDSLYDLRGSAEEGEFQLVSHAIIRQSTGEAWMGAKVTLSTARPSTSMAPGILKPWRINTREFSSSVSSGNISPSEPAAVADSTPSGGPEAESTDASESTTVSITLPNRENILSDNSDHKVTLGKAALKGTLTHVAVPSLSQYVYLKAHLKNTSVAPLVGTINTFLDGSYVGNITLSTPAAVGEEFDVFLGPDQRMRLKRTLKRGDVEKSGIFGGKVQVVNQWEIEVANFTKKSKQVFVYDQYPIAADPNISTEYVGASRNVDTKDANGILSWKIDLKASEQTKFNFTYSLTFPKEVWENFSHGYRDQKKRRYNDVQYYQNASPKAAPVQQQYNIEKMLKR
ncbi:MAG: hypothetical protein LDLANPLL_00032 [Turneriella sp.]|nr:hypothetical protein [Turneriella sp.]